MATKNGAAYKNSTARDAEVMPAPMKIAPNSSPKITPTARPGSSDAPSRGANGTPRSQHHSQHNRAAPAERMAPCNAGEMPAVPSFIATMFSPQARQSASMVAAAEAGRA